MFERIPIKYWLTILMSSIALLATWAANEGFDYLITLSNGYLLVFIAILLGVIVILGGNFINNKFASRRVNLDKTISSYKKRLSSYLIDVDEKRKIIMEALDSSEENIDHNNT